MTTDDHSRRQSQIAGLVPRFASLIYRPVFRWIGKHAPKTESTSLIF